MYISPVYKNGANFKQHVLIFKKKFLMQVLFVKQRRRMYSGSWKTKFPATYISATVQPRRQIDKTRAIGRLASKYDRDYTMKR